MTRMLIALMCAALAAAAYGQTTPGYLPIGGGTLGGSLTAPQFIGPLTGLASANLPLSGGTITGALAAKDIENCRWVDSSSNWGTGDFGAKVNAALVDAGTSGAVCIASGSYTYSTGIALATPQTLICQGVGTCVLNYTGTGNAVKVGPDGLTVSTYSPDAYVVQGFLFTGGASAVEGIYINEYVVKSEILFNEFLNFGNSSAWDLWFQGENWESRVFGNYVWNTGPCNGIYENAADPANGINGDYGQSQGSFAGNHIQGCETAVYVNGFNVKVNDNTLTGSPAIILGGYGNRAVIANNDIELTAAGSAPCIEYGDMSGPRSPSYTQSARLIDNFCNTHNSNSGFTGKFLGPATTGQGMQNFLLIGNTVVDLASGQPLVVENNLASQTNNNAYNNDSQVGSGAFSPMPVGTPARLHTTGSNLGNWGGVDGDLLKTVGSFNNANGTLLPSTLTGYRGTSGTEVQLSDGSGVSGTDARFAADGSVTNGLVASGAGVPSGSCANGLYINTAATSASTVLYVCYPANTWTAVNVP